VSVLRIDMIGGASGDMLLGAFIELGVLPSRLEELWNGLGVGRLELEVEAGVDHGIRGTRVRISFHGAVPPGPTAHHSHRSWAEIRALLQRAELPSSVRTRALRVFERLAHAEASVHSIEPDAVEFHELGAYDSIADISGACAALEWLGVHEVEASPFLIGRGMIECSHGIYPLPAPAVMELLKGQIVQPIPVEAETVTPTGAALIVDWLATHPARETGPRLLRRVGHGLGHRTLPDRPNLLRATLWDSVSAPQGSPEVCQVIEAQVDNVPGEWFGSAVDELLAAGALDVFLVPIQMKKQRPGILLTVLTTADRRDALVEAIFLNVPTLGLREYEVRRTVLERRWVTVETQFGSVRIKLGIWGGRVVVRAPEWEDCVARGREHRVPPRQVWEAAVRAIRE